MATATKTEEGKPTIKKPEITFDLAMEKIIKTIQAAAAKKGIRNLGVSVYRSGFTITIDGKVCDRNLKTVQQFNSIVNTL